MGTIILGSSANRKGITVEPNEVFFNGSVVQAIMSGVVEIWSYEKPLVPIMTSDTSEVGQVIYSKQSTWNNYVHYAYRAFNGEHLGEESGWGVKYNDNTGEQYIGFKFVNPVILRGCVYKNYFKNNYPSAIIKIQGSNNGSTWNDLSDNLFNEIYGNENYEKGIKLTIKNNDNVAYTHIRMLINGGLTELSDTTKPYIVIGELQFYGKQVVGLVPTMTSNTTPSGEAISSGYYNDACTNYRVFDNNENTAWHSTNSAERYIGYKFAKPTIVKQAYVINPSSSSGINVPHNRAITSFKIQASNDGSIWEDITDTVSNPTSYSSLTVVEVANRKEFLYYRLYVLSTNNTDLYCALGELQFYG